jgi:amidase
MLKRPTNLLARRDPCRVIFTAVIGAISLVATSVSGIAWAVTDFTANNGATWRFHDAGPSGLDTGSIRSIGNTLVDGFGNIFVEASAAVDEPFNGQMMRGFGLRLTGRDTLSSTNSVSLGGLLVARTIMFDQGEGTARFFDSFANTTGQPVSVAVSFGGALGYGGNGSATQSPITATSSGDANVSSADSWTVSATSAASRRPIGTVMGSPAPFSGALAGTGNQERNPFATPMATSGHEANFHGYIHRFTVPAGQTRSLAQFVHAGAPGDSAGVQSYLASAAGSPNFAGLNRAELCSLANWDLAALAGAPSCGSAVSLPMPAPVAAREPVTTSPYDVTGQTIADLQADMEAGITTSEEITQAYLDRIAVYDSGPFAFHAWITVASDALAQARAADAARAAGQTGDLLGIPVGIKDLYDTADMPTTGGTKALEGWRPHADSTAVARLRQAGAVILGKTNLSEFANSGSYSESGYGQVWNGLYPSKTSFGSSGGSAVAVATSMAAGTMGTQTGVSLYAPSTGASLTTFRGTDGMTSCAGVMPLTWGQDHCGPIAKTVTDLSYILNAVTGTDPLDIFTVRAAADSRRPADWTAALRTTALAGKRVGFIPGSFTSAFADDGTGEAVMAHFADLEAAGATMVSMNPPPGGGSSPGGSRSIEGWAQYIDLQEDFPFADGNGVLASPKVLAWNQRSSAGTTARMTAAQIDARFGWGTGANAQQLTAAQPAGIAGTATGG